MFGVAQLNFGQVEVFRCFLMFFFDHFHRAENEIDAIFGSSLTTTNFLTIGRTASIENRRRAKRAGP